MLPKLPKTIALKNQPYTMKDKYSIHCIVGNKQVGRAKVPYIPACCMVSKETPKI